MHDEQRPIAIGYPSYSGDLKKNSANIAHDNRIIIT